VTAQFTIQGLAGGQADLLGIWQPVSSPGLTFSAPIATGAEREADDEAIWSVSLPANPTLASKAVQHQVETLEVTQQAISRAGQTLQQLPAHWLEETSFALESTADSATPEATLRRNLAHLQGGEAEVSFGLGLPTDWSQTVAEYKAFMQQVLRLLRPTLHVETRVEGALLAHTLVELSGDFETAWSSQGALTHIQLHRQILSLTLESRLALLQLLAQTSAGAVVLAARLNPPVGAILALPAVWRYVQDVVQQAQKVADLQRQMEQVR
jgi:hypothetical protein